MELDALEFPTLGDLVNEAQIITENYSFEFKILFPEEVRIDIVTYFRRKDQRTINSGSSESILRKLMLRK